MRIDDVAQFDGKTTVQHFAEDIFDESFDSCMDKTFTDLEADFKSYASMTLAQGQLQFLSGIKNKVKTFIQWSRDQIRMGKDPVSVPFPAHKASMLLRRHNTHKRIVKGASTYWLMQQNQ